MGLLGMKCRQSSSTPTYTGSTLLMNIQILCCLRFIQTPLACFLASLFFAVPVNHSAACHNLFLQHAERYNKELRSMLERSHLN